MRPLIITLATALVCAAAVPVASQERAYASSVSRAELVRTGASDLFAGLAAARPAWLAVLADTLNGGGFEVLAVYVDGRHAGDARLLRTLHPDGVAAVRYVSADYVRRVDPRYPRTRFTAALWISTRTPAGDGGLRARRAVTVYAAARAYGMSRALHHAVDEAGWERQGVRSPRGTTFTTGHGPAGIPAFGIGASALLADNLGAEVQADYAPDQTMYRYGTLRRPVGATFSSADVALLATYSRQLGRFGVGPVVRAARWQWGEEECICQNLESSSSLGVGLAGSATLAVPAGRRILVEVRGGVRHFLSHPVDGYRAVPDLDLSGTEAVISFGIGLRR